MVPMSDEVRQRISHGVIGQLFGSTFTILQNKVNYFPIYFIASNKVFCYRSLRSHMIQHQSIYQLLIYPTPVMCAGDLIIMDKNKFFVLPMKLQEILG
jgi:hypothetical protein